MRKKSTKYCPRCDRDLPVDRFELKPKVNGRSNGYRPRCIECTLPQGTSVRDMKLQQSPDPNPSGLCMCGCGQKTLIATQSHTAYGWVKGKPRRFVVGHQAPVDPFSPERYTVSPDTGCWIWNGGLTSKGYACASDNGKTTSGHALFYRHFKGAIPEGTELDHLCRNRACVNPDHMEPVTRVVNLRRGAGTILNVEQVVEIRRLWATGQYTRPQLGKMFGVASTTIQMVVHRHTWKDVA